MNQDVINANKEHPEITHSTYLHPHIRTDKDMIHWGLVKLGYPLQTVELTEEQMSMCLGDAIERWSKFASFDIQNIIVPLEGYDKEKGLDLSRWNVADIHDISFQRDTLLHGFGSDMFFGQYAMMNAYGGAGIFPFSNYGGLGSASGSWVSLHNLHEHFETINRVTGSLPQWRFFKTTQRLVIYPSPKQLNHSILLECECEPPPEEIYGNEYVKRLFLALLKIQLGIVRKKFSSVQLIGGGQIDTSIGDEGKEEYEKAMEDLQKTESMGQIWAIG